MPDSSTPLPVRVLIAAGGTMGHIAPALVLANYLRDKGHSVSFVGSSGRGDERAIQAAGYAIRTFAISGLPRRGSAREKIAAVGRAAAAVRRSSTLLGEIRPDVLLAGGGYVGAPVALAARLARTPVVVTEADAHLGIANRIAGRVAQRLCTAYALPQYRWKQTVTGRPVDPAFFAATRDDARRKLGIDDDDRVLVAVGGSGGAQQLSDAVYAAFGADETMRVDDHKLVVLHVTGRRDYERYAGRRGHHHLSEAQQRYRLIEFSSDMPDLLAAADVVVSRAGGSVFELAAAGCSCILVPGDLAGDHQRKNAQHFATAGAALVLEPAQCDGAKLGALVRTTLADEMAAQREQLAEHIRALARPNAAAEIGEIVVAAGQHKARQRGRRA